jgi:maleylpyruvate isomerase
MAMKGVTCEFVPVNLLTEEPESQSHLQRNPMGYVPVLEVLNSESPIRYLSESVAIIEWLEETLPSPSLFPKHPLMKARARHLAEIVNSGTQPLQNLNVAQFHSSDAAEQRRWNTHWIRKGLEAYEHVVKETSGTFSIGDQITFPDLFLIPQCYNAKRNEVAIEDFPTIYRIYQEASKTESCKASAPEKYQPQS